MKPRNQGNQTPFSTNVSSNQLFDKKKFLGIVEDHSNNSINFKWLTCCGCFVIRTREMSTKTGKS